LCLTSNCRYFGTGNSSLVLSGLRVTRLLLNALSWTGKELGYYDHAGVQSIFDANITYNLSWAQPYFQITNTSNLTLAIPSGTLYAFCTSPNGTDKHFLIDFSFTNLSVTGTVHNSCFGVHCGGVITPELARASTLRLSPLILT